MSKPPALSVALLKLVIDLIAAGHPQPAGQRTYLRSVIKAVDLPMNSEEHILDDISCIRRLQRLILARIAS